ncbi:MAG: hypothetical protein PVI71_06680 [Desulfobacterales bacterium]|jgi:hypothetical protein
MLSSDEQNRIYQQAYVPEHLPDYVAAISGSQPYLFEDYLCFFHKDHLIFIGYPLGEKPIEISQAYQAACKRFNPRTITLVAEKIFLAQEKNELHSADRYYRMNLPLISLDPDVAYMVRRAEKELMIKVGQFGRVHKKIIKSFISRQDLTAEQVHIFKQVPNYMKRSKTAYLLEARKSDRLVAFSIVDMGSARYAFYQFNFRSAKITVPGASDLLFNEMVRLAQSEGKQRINLGLGVHAGIRRFKEKWGGEPFLEHCSVFIQRSQITDIGKLSKKL